MESLLTLNRTSVKFATGFHEFASAYCRHDRNKVISSLKDDYATETIVG